MLLSRPLIIAHRWLNMSILLFLFVFPALSLGQEQRCHPEDRDAILAIKNSFSNPELVPSWSPGFDCCYIFECDETTGRVIDFSVTYSDLSGKVPDAIGDLTHLQTLRLRKMPYLVGEIPRSITRLRSLLYFDISWTNISGRVPPFLGDVKSLMFIYLTFNKLSGPIPSTLSTLPNITGIDLSRNQLTGTIPESFGHFVGRTPAIDFSHNKLSGRIPASLANSDFSRIDISRNNFSGDALMFFGQAKTTDTIVISRNRFKFNFSLARFGGSLVELDISHNKIYGSIPSQITDCVYLQGLNVSYNRLCGEIPTGWKLKYRSEPFDSSSYVHNRCLCGPPLDVKCKP